MKNHKQIEEIRNTLEKLKLSMRESGYSEQTIRSYVFFNRKLCEFADMPPRLIRDQHVQSFVDYLALETKSYRSYSITLVLSSIRKLYNDILDKPIARNVFVPTEQDYHHGEFDKDMARKLIESVESKKHQAILAILYNTGMRIQDVVRIYTDDLRIKKGTLTIRDKNHEATEVVKLSPMTMGYVKEYIGKGLPPEPYLFPGRKGKPHFSFRAVEKLFQKALEKINHDKKLSLLSFRKAARFDIEKPLTEDRSVARKSNTANPERRRKFSKNREH